MTPTSIENTQLDPQTAYFAELCHLVNTKQLTMNQAYNKAKEGWSNGDGEGISGFGGSFQAWLDYAINQGWIQDGLVINDGIKENYGNQTSLTTEVKDPENKGSNRAYIIMGGILIAVTIGIILWNKSQKKEE